MLMNSVKSELVKLTGKRATCLVLICLTALVPSVSFGFVLFSGGIDSQMAGIFDSVLQNPEELLLLIFKTGNLFCVLLGVIGVGAEYGSSAILRTYQHFGDRTTAILGKLICLALLSVATSLFAATAGVCILNFTGVAAFAIPHPVALVGYYTVNCLILTVLSFGVVLVASHTVASLLAMVTILYLLPDILRIVLSFFSPDLAFLVGYLPGDAAGAGVGMSITAGTYAGINPVVGVVVAGAVALIVAVVGAIVQKRRDL
jgi:ABC-type transport system involved in multi-copper enzyme maturation permease subunit